MPNNHVITVSPVGKQFKSDPEKSVLDNALAAGIMLKHGCRDGRCGDCRTTLTSGRVIYPDEVNLSDSDLLGTTLLPCQAKSISDLRIEAPEVTEFDNISIQKLPCRLIKKEMLADDVVHLKCQLAPGSVFNYLPGQYVDLTFKNVGCRSYSMANASAEDGFIDFHIRLSPNGKVTPWIFKELQPKQLLTLEGPFGSFYLKEQKQNNTIKPAIFLASGTGFAPIKSLIEQLINEEKNKPVHLYWGGRKLKDLYFHDLCCEWTKKHHWFSYTPVLSDETTEKWNGRKGFVHLAVIEDYPDLSNYEVYACGSPLVIESAKKDFTKYCQLKLKNFFSDTFV